MATGKRIEVNEADLREFIEAAEEVREEATCAPDSHGFTITNVLDTQTENRFALALEDLKFDLAGASRG